MTPSRIPLLLCSLLLCPPAMPQPTKDVPFDDHPYGDAIAEMAERGILQGYPDSTARALQPMTRYEFAAAWARLCDTLGLHADAPSLQGMVTDVPVDHWARQSIESLAALGLLPVLPDPDVDPLHWAAAGVAAVAIEPPRGPGHLLYQGERVLLRREYIEMLFRTCQAAAKQGLGPLTPGDLVGIGPAEFATQHRIIRGMPDPADLTRERLGLDDPMLRGSFCAATTRLLDWWARP